MYMALTFDHAAEPLVVPEPSSFEPEIGTEQLKRYKPGGTDQISAKLIQPRGNSLLSGIHKLFNFI
jgi:hypothetical protein